MLCFVTTVFMIGYWVYKFGIKDEDVSLVDYKLVVKTKHNELPMISLCIQNPFLIDELKKINPRVNESIYSAYLKGEFVDNQLTSIDYDNVTINVFDYVSSSYILWRNGSSSMNDTKAFSKHVTFAGFYNSSSLKCFGMKIIDEYYRDVKKIDFFFKQYNLFNSSTRGSTYHLLYTHYPNHFLLAGEPGWFFSGRRSTDNTFWYYLNIKEAEILERRNKGRDPCMIAGKYYDEFVLKKHAEQNKCQAPYHMAHKNVPILCTTKAQLAAYKYDFLTLKGKYTPHPCRSMTINWAYKEFEEIDGFKFPLAIEIVYPDQFKIIRQSQAVDIHVFIGNIGGYIGLFLGNSYNQNVILPHLCRYLK